MAVKRASGVFIDRGIQASEEATPSLSICVNCVVGQSVVAHSILVLLPIEPKKWGNIQFI